jgi:hypothetical protein
MPNCRHTGSRTEISRRTEGGYTIIIYRCNDCQGTYEEYA